MQTFRAVNRRLQKLTDNFSNFICTVLSATKVRRAAVPKLSRTSSSQYLRICMSSSDSIFGPNKFGGRDLLAIVTEPGNDKIPQHWILVGEFAECAQTSHVKSFEQCGKQTGKVEGISELKQLFFEKPLLD